MRPSRRWLRLFLGTALLAAAMGGCGFDLAGIGEATFGAVTAGGDGGNRADLFVVAPTALTLDEAKENEPTHFAVHLTQAPTGPVTIPVAVNPSGRITVKPTSLTFTPENFGADQTVTASVTRNSEIDPSDYVIDLGPATSPDSLFDGATPPKVKLTLKDANQAINISPPVTTTPFTVSESGTTATFYVSLAAKPIDRVVITAKVATQSPNKEIAIALDDGTVAPVGDAGADGGDAGADAGSGNALAFGDSVQIVFESGTEVGTSRKIVVKGVDDDVVDGNQAAQVVFDPAQSTDPRFSGKVSDPIPFTNLDNDSPNIEITSSGPYFTSEAENAVSPAIKVRLTKAPTGTVTIPLGVGLIDNRAEGKVVPSTALVFTPANYMTEQTIPVFGVDDKYADGDQTWTLTLGPATSSQSTDAYNGISTTVQVTNTDNDVAGIVSTPASGLVTTEAGGTATFNVHLKSAPMPGQSVQVQVTSSDTTEGTVAPASLSFDENNYNIDKLVTVTGVDDTFVDGNISYTVTPTIVSGGTDPLYYSKASSGAGNLSAPVSCKNNDNDVATVSVTPATLNLSEGGIAGSYTVHLGAQPAPGATVRVTLAPQVAALPYAQTFNTGSVSLDFTSGNFADQTASFQLLEDCYKNSTTAIAVKVSVSIVAGADAAYGALNPPNVNVNPIDNDSATISVNPVNLTTVKSPPTSASFNISLSSRPWEDVTFAISSDDTTRGTPDTSSVTFPKVPSNTNCPPDPVTVTVNPGSTTGGTYKIIVAKDSVQKDPNYKVPDPTDVTVTPNP